jgi:hypothetical protein
MNRNDEQTTPPFRLQRREFLTGVLVAGGYGIVSGRFAANANGAVPVRVGHAATLVNGTSRIVVRPQYASDGLLTNYVLGTVMAIRGGEVVVQSAAATASVAVAVTSATEVCARSTVAAGDLGSCRVGDALAIGTTWTDAGRVARWIVANPSLGRLHVATVHQDTGAITGTWQHRKTDETADGAVVTVTPFTNYALKGRTGTGSPGMYDLVESGDLIYFSGTADTPDFPGLNVWALFVGEG